MDQKENCTNPKSTLFEATFSKDLLYLQKLVEENVLEQVYFLLYYFVSNLIKFWDHQIHAKKKLGEIKKSQYEGKNYTHNFIQLYFEFKVFFLGSVFCWPNFVFYPDSTKHKTNYRVRPKKTKVGKYRYIGI